MIVIVVVIVLNLVIGVIPGSIAFSRNHRNAPAIMLCGFLFWPVGLIWALTDNVDKPSHRASRHTISRTRRRSRPSRDAVHQDSADALEDLIDP